MVTRVLVVDDSALMRKHLSTLFKAAGFEVHLARNGQEAVEQVLTLEPHVVTLDINMPEMDGLTALSLIMAVRPTPVVMVSSLTAKGTSATLEALSMGAIDFVTKPGGTISLSIDQVARELITKVKTAAAARVKKFNWPAALAAEEVVIEPKKNGGATSGLVLIGVSTGGPRTLEEILPALPAVFPWPILIAQHMPASFTASFASRMNSTCKLQVKEVNTLMPLETGCIYIARGGGDMSVSARGGVLMALPKPESNSHAWHPSADILVNSALEHLAPKQLIGVLLTGMGTDGAESMTRLKQAGGRTIAESEETAVIYGMPRELAERGGATLILPAQKIASQLSNWLL